MELIGFSERGASARESSAYCVGIRRFQRGTVWGRSFGLERERALSEREFRELELFACFLFVSGVFIPALWQG